MKHVFVAGLVTGDFLQNNFEFLLKSEFRFLLGRTGKNAVASHSLSWVYT